MGKMKPRRENVELKELAIVLDVWAKAWVVMVKVIKPERAST